jgi:F-type H+-transporting ATPase subunit b
MLLSSLISVDPGLMCWTTIIFVGLYFFLTKAAWKPIQTALKERETSIDDALKQAEKARQ